VDSLISQLTDGSSSPTTGYAVDELA
jgi:hypothetical protein